MLSFVSLDGREYVCSGWGAKTDWYKNILANPQVTVQVGQKIYSAKARRIQEIDEYTQIAQEMFATGGDTHFASWLESFGIEHNLQDMIAKKERLYLVAFDENKETSPPPMPVDLKWVWGVIVAILFIIWLVAR